MKICLLRHGETDWNNLGKVQGREDIPLNVNGIKQAENTVEYLKKTCWKAIITSPLSRAKTTAEIISRGIGNIKIYEEFDFIEQDFGRASGMTAEEWAAAFPDGKYAGVEPFETLQARTVTALLKYMGKYKGDNIIIVSHGAALNSILSCISNGKLGSGKTRLKNGGITLLEKTDNELKLIYCNKTVDEILF